MKKYFFNPMEVAAALSIGRSRTYEMLATGQIPSIRIGRSIRVPVDLFEKWVEERVRPQESNKG